MGSIILVTIFSVFVSWLYLFLPIKSTVFEILFGIIGLFVIPAGFIKKFKKRELKEFGFRAPVLSKFVVLYSAFLLIFFTLTFTLALKSASFSKFYSTGASLSEFALIVVPGGLLYYLAEEFLFRGFLFWGLWEKVKYHSFWINGAIFSLLHIGKPFIEMPMSFVLAVALSYLSFKTKSFFPAAGLHWTLATTINIIVRV